MLGSIGMPELLIIFTIAFFIFGAKRLPQIGKGFGDAVREIRGLGKTVTDVTDELEDEVHGVDRTVRQTLREAGEQIEDPVLARERHVAALRDSKREPGE